VVDWTAKTPVVPTVPGTLPDVEAKLTGILAKLAKLPYEAIGKELKSSLVTLNQTLKTTDKAVADLNSQVTPGLRRALASADRVLKNTDATLVGKDAPGQQQLRDALREIAAAARSLRVLSDYLERHPDALLRGKSGG
jgi:paraquat-inducible protein B